MFVCYVLSSIGLCDELITLSKESFRLWRVVVCDHESLVDEEAIARAGLQSQKNAGTVVVSRRTKINVLKPKGRPLYFKTQSVPRRKHFISVVKPNQFIL
jgi:hypothetical protein